ncbi:hypothetical protein HBH70_064660 [Parastagonospora nodorum]|nr:hypothetical protein HBH51_048810 [Parastagonospora nodorum]KAH4038599.1 hypothetical protein HBI09_053330 [Parastagonospora nodorum]KAH4202590.1 hypothetical protein HBH42_020200 [Parastagonospora nodorum]KAH4934226.1 hypothetical protein HBH74_087890 [Parastagonospora nodorum]KAH4970640.1 hypothetical protein HBH73_055110 [Parastagonospora nodorum]
MVGNNFSTFRNQEITQKKLLSAHSWFCPYRKLTQGFCNRGNSEVLPVVAVFLVRLRH